MLILELYTSILHHHRLQNTEVSCVMMLAFRDTLPSLPQVASPAPVLQQATLTLELWWGTVPGGVGFTVLCRHLLSLWVHALCAHSCVKFQLRGSMVSETNLGNPISWVFSDKCGFIVQIIDASFEELSPLVERAVHPLLGKAHTCMDPHVLLLLQFTPVSIPLATPTCLSPHAHLIKTYIP